MMRVATEGAADRGAHWSTSARSGSHDDPHRRPALSPRFGPRKMDTLLVVRGETSRRFRPGRGHRPALLRVGGDRVSRAADGSRRNRDAALSGKRLAVPRRRRTSWRPIGTDHRRGSRGRVCCEVAGNRGSQDDAGPAIVSRSHGGRGNRFHRPREPIASLPRRPRHRRDAAHEWVEIPAATGRDWGRGLGFGDGGLERYDSFAAKAPRSAPLLSLHSPLPLAPDPRPPTPNPQSPIPNPQSPIPNPQSPIPNPQS